MYFIDVLKEHKTKVTKIIYSILWNHLWIQRRRKGSLLKDEYVYNNVVNKTKYFTRYIFFNDEMFIIVLWYYSLWISTKKFINKNC